MEISLKCASWVSLQTKSLAEKWFFFHEDSSFRPKYCSKHRDFEIFGNKAIRHIQMYIRHMWQVANGLDIRFWVQHKR